MKFITLILTALLLNSTVFADNITVYRWVDKNNVVHFSQHQPEHNNYTELSLSAIPKTPEPIAVPQKEEQENTKSDEQVVTESLDKCEAAKENVRTLEQYDNIQYTDESGNLKVLTDVEKSQQLEINKKQVEVYCNIQ
ncbi:DUF4124 domain-containing protein [Thalassotalea sediminis]|uniref:DUF4124 domain-containing protein n=1 Tax=Thalassotalea sediminis TaxID=1759089 RepID=UPI002572CAD7|nr:DUF4124 domain-containing protein [Thalassotalea sediminis]